MYLSRSRLLTRYNVLGVHSDPNLLRAMMHDISYLRQIGLKAAVPILVKSLEDPNPDVRFWAADMIGEMSPGYIEYSRRIIYRQYFGTSQEI
jgi:hypothetical protein